MFSPTVRGWYPARVTRLAGVLPSWPACSNWSCRAMSCECSSAAAVSNGARLSGLRHGMLLVCLGTLLFAPLDLIIVSHEAVGSQEVYLSGKTVDVTVSLGLGSIFRPIINAFMLLTIAIECWGLDWLQIIRWHSLRMRARMILLKYQQGNP